MRIIYMPLYSIALYPDLDNGISAYAKTCIRAIVKETTCHKVKAGMLYMFTCMGGSIGRGKLKLLFSIISTFCPILKNIILL